jgi:hypothetical protein
MLPGARMMRALLRVPHTDTRAAISCGVLILTALAALIVLYIVADWVATTEIRAATEFRPSLTFADIFRH